MHVSYLNSSDLRAATPCYWGKCSLEAPGTHAAFHEDLQSRQMSKPHLDVTGTFCCAWKPHLATARHASILNIVQVCPISYELRFGGGGGGGGLTR